MNRAELIHTSSAPYIVSEKYIFSFSYCNIIPRPYNYVTFLEGGISRDSGREDSSERRKCTIFLISFLIVVDMQASACYIVSISGFGLRGLIRKGGSDFLSKNNTSYIFLLHNQLRNYFLSSRIYSSIHRPIEDIDSWSKIRSVLSRNDGKAFSFKTQTAASFG